MVNGAGRLRDVRELYNKHVMVVDSIHSPDFDEVNLLHIFWTKAWT